MIIRPRHIFLRNYYQLLSSMYKWRVLEVRWITLIGSWWYASRPLEKASSVQLCTNSQYCNIICYSLTDHLLYVLFILRFSTSVGNVIFTPYTIPSWNTVNEVTGTDTFWNASQKKKIRMTNYPSLYDLIYIIKDTTTNTNSFYPYHL